MTKKYNHKGITERILSLISARSLTKYKLAKDIGVSETTLSSNFNRGSKWSVDVLSTIAEHFRVSLDWLINGDALITSNLIDLPESKYKQVPYLGYAECGAPPSTWNEAGSKFAEMNDVAHLRNPFILIAKGDSMRPYINPGDKLLCADQPEKIKDRTAVIALFKSPPDTYEANAKLILFSKRMDMITLYSINTMYPPTFHHEEEITKLYKVVRIIREVK